MVRTESSVGFLLQQAIADLQLAGIDEAQADAALLLCSCLSLSRTALYLAVDDEVTAGCRQRFSALLARRKEREPLAYILGEREFWSLNFTVTRDVLIPRPETEFLLETVLTKRNTGCSAPRILDMCCGSGVIAVVLARELSLQVTAADCSPEALAVARKNSIRHGVDHLVSLLQTDLFHGFRTSRPFFLIVANPPYVKHAEIISNLEPEVSRYEPLLALDGGASGLEVIERMVQRLGDVLAYGGDFFMEIGAGQAHAIQSIFTDHGGDDIYDFVTCYYDYSNRERVIHARRKKQQG